MAMTIARTVAVVALAVLACAQPARGQSSATWTGGVAQASAYVWRGFVIEDRPCIQPTASVQVGHLTVTSWFNLIADAGAKIWSEHDLTVDYSRSFGDWKLSAGYTNYFFPSADSERVSHEFYAGAAWSGPLNPSVRVYQDVTHGNGTYVSLGVSQTIELGSSKISATPAVALSYNNHQWVAESGWSDLNLGVTIAYPLSERVDLSGAFNYSKSLRTAWFPSRAYATLTVSLH